MAKKEFIYRGKTLEELQSLSTDELALLLPTDARRKIRRGFTHEEKNLLKKLAKRDRVKTHAREMLILPSMVGKTVLVHNGKEFSQLLLIDEMIGKRLGMYVLTRKMVKHSSSGVSTKKERK